MATVLNLIIRIAPSFLIGHVFISLLPKRENIARCFLHIVLFTISRDTFTPLGLWKIEARRSFYLRLPDNPIDLMLLTCRHVVVSIPQSLFTLSQPPAARHS